VTGQRADRQGTAAHWRERARDPLVRPIVGLGVTEIVCWGTTLYALGVLGQPIAADTGWSRAVVFGGLSLGLVIASAASTAVGRMIDRRGASAACSAPPDSLLPPPLRIGRSTSSPGACSGWRCA
jgi:hypothetical protein